MRGITASLIVAASLVACTALAEEPSELGAPPAPRQLNLEGKVWTGDFDAIFERRMLRVLIPYSRTLFFIDKGQERGITAELARDLERYINQKHKQRLGKRPLTVHLIPTTRDKLFSELREGRGDIAAGNLTVTGALTPAAAER